jgi:hypothetical protein
LLAHFIATAEGVWVIYLSVAFQKFLSNLSVFYKNELVDIITNIGNIYTETEKYRTTNFVDPLYRESIKNEFIKKATLSLLKIYLLCKKNIILETISFYSNLNCYHGKF